MPVPIDMNAVTQSPGRVEASPQSRANIRPSVCDACPVASGLQDATFDPARPGCHADEMEGIEPVSICRGLAIANGWLNESLARGSSASVGNSSRPSYEQVRMGDDLETCTNPACGFRGIQPHEVKYPFCGRRTPEPAE